MRTRCLRNLKKPASSKRTNLPRRIDYARNFLRDWARLSRSGRYDMKRLKAVMLQLIANDAPLGPEWKDHSLKGAWAKYRECHVGGDFLLIYRIDDADSPGGTVYFTRVGTHAELFK